MKHLSDYNRTRNIICETIGRLKLNLKGMTVLTEAASGNFVVTPIIAALAGADIVYIVCKESLYGTVDEVMDHLMGFAECCGIPSDKICQTENKNEVAGKVNLVTNSGFVRPIDDAFIQLLPKDAAISLMFESWEFRNEDIDLGSCLKHQIPVLGVNENDERLRIFRYVGLSVLKLLFEQQIEVFKGRFLVLSSGDYLREITRVLTANGAVVETVDTDAINAGMATSCIEGHFDAVVVAEQKNPDCLLGRNSNYIDLTKIDCDGTVIHIAGVIDDAYVQELGYRKHPDRKIGYGYMGVTTEYMGVRPVIELNAAGLKVGQLLVEGKRSRNNNMRQAIDYALQDTCAMDFDMMDCD